jgi:hypothetical protein
MLSTEEIHAVKDIRIPNTNHVEMLPPMRIALLGNMDANVRPAAVVVPAEIPPTRPTFVDGTPILVNTSTRIILEFAHIYLLVNLREAIVCEG